MTGPVLEIVGVGEELAPGIVEADLARGLGFGVSSPVLGPPNKASANGGGFGLSTRACGASPPRCVGAALRRTMPRSKKPATAARGA